MSNPVFQANDVGVITRQRFAATRR